MLGAGKERVQAIRRRLAALPSGVPLRTKVNLVTGVVPHGISAPNTSTQMTRLMVSTAPTSLKITVSGK